MDFQKHVVRPSGGRQRTVGSIIRERGEITKPNPHLEEKARRYDRLMAAALDTIIEATADGRCLFVSPNVREIFGYSANSLIGETLFQYIHPDDLENTMRAFLATLASHQPTTATLRLRDATGQWRWVEARGRAFLHEGERNISVVLRDITATIEERERLEYLAYHDPLTGLANRRLFRDRLEQAIPNAIRHNESLGLILVDLDHFKPVNDTYGHVVGDGVLEEIARRLLQHRRQTDTVARIAGDEFAILLCGLQRPVDCARVARGIVELFSEPMQVGEHTLNVTISLGLAIAPQDSREPDSLITYADRALYAAKNNGKNRLVVYTSDLSPR